MKVRFWAWLAALLFLAIPSQVRAEGEMPPAEAVYQVVNGLDGGESKPTGGESKTDTKAEGRVEEEDELPEGDDDEAEGDGDEPEEDEHEEDVSHLEVDPDTVDEDAWRSVAGEKGPQLREFGLARGLQLPEDAKAALDIEVAADRDIQKIVNDLIVEVRTGNLSQQEAEARADFEEAKIRLAVDRQILDLRLRSDAVSQIARAHKGADMATVREMLAEGRPVTAVREWAKRDAARIAEIAKKAGQKAVSRQLASDAKKGEFRPAGGSGGASGGALVDFDSMTFGELLEHV